MNKNAYELSKQLVLTLENNAKAFNGSDRPNYPYLTGMLESILESLPDTTHNREFLKMQIAWASKKNG